MLPESKDNIVAMTGIFSHDWEYEEDPEEFEVEVDHKIQSSVDYVIECQEQGRYYLSGMRYRRMHRMDKDSDGFKWTVAKLFFLTLGPDILLVSVSVFVACVLW